MQKGKQIIAELPDNVLIIYFLDTQDNYEKFKDELLLNTKVYENILFFAKIQNTSRQIRFVFFLIGISLNFVFFLIGITLGFLHGDIIEQVVSM